VTLKIYMLIL